MAGVKKEKNMTNKTKTKLYIDVDGVLVGTPNYSNKVVIAQGAVEFLRFALEYFDCYWLTSHCSGRAGTVMSYLRSFNNSEVIDLAAQIRPTDFSNRKTEAIDLSSDFIWLDDSPSAGDLECLRKHDKMSCWIEVNTHIRADDLLRVKKLLAIRIGQEHAL